uniref:Cytochrome P450 n=1 Tax=Photinus pyralis TaxID=7054 RepID=A0A1Y1KXB9_PHOPY
MLTVLVVILALAFIFKIHVRNKYSYWQTKKIPYVQPHFPLGNAENPFSRKRHFGEWLQMLYRKFREQNTKLAGIYIGTSPYYFPVDPDVIKCIIQTDFHHFPDRGFYYNEKDDPLSAHLCVIGGEKWKNLRAMLTPTFTSGKMRMMFDTLLKCTDPMEKSMSEVGEKGLPVDIKDVAARFTTDVVGSCAFGLECNSFESVDAAFRVHGRKIFSPRTKMETLKILFLTASPVWGRRLGLSLFPKESTEFFFNIVKQTVEYRRGNGIHRNDILQILMEVGESDGEHSLTIAEIAAQAFGFFVAGFETSSTTMSFFLYELALNADLQQKVRDEIKLVLGKHAGKVTYEAIMEMKFMDQVISETLRKYPPLSFLTRQCVKNYRHPSHDVEIKTGDMILISLLALHRDPEYFPDPETFDPERFSDENKNSIRPFSYIPFGGGPRGCLGVRFGRLQTKVGLTCLLKNYSFSLNPKSRIPLTFDKYSFILSAEKPIFLNFEKLHAGRA